MIPTQIKQAPSWCVSKDKVPLDMYVLDKGLEWGVSTRRSHCCYKDYGAATDAAARTGYVPTLWVDSGAHGAYVIDVEKTCPAGIRRAILLALHDHIVHLERSLSGKGYHMLVTLPGPEALPNAKYKKWFEVLTLHHCAFTGREIGFGDAYGDEFPENEPLPDQSMDDADKELLALLSKPIEAKAFHEALSAGKSVQTMTPGADIGAYKSALSAFDGRHADLFNAMCDFIYEKTVDGDFHGDWSSYEFGYASKLHYLLQRLAADMMDMDGCHYTLKLSQEEAVMLVYMALKQVLPPRDKHGTYRNGLPWLLYTSERVYVKTFADG